MSNSKNGTYCPIKGGTTYMSENAQNEKMGEGQVGNICGDVVDDANFQSLLPPTWSASVEATVKAYKDEASSVPFVRPTILPKDYRGIQAIALESDQDPKSE